MTHAGFMLLQHKSNWTTWPISTMHTHCSTYHPPWKPPPPGSPSLHDLSPVHDWLCREEMLDFMFKCHEVVTIIMKCFACGLGLDENFFKNVSCCHLDRSPAVILPICLFQLLCMLTHFLMRMRSSAGQQTCKS